jgi:Caspase domain/Tetratricopeptide repeat
MRLIFVLFVFSFFIGAPAGDVYAQQANIRNADSRVALVIGNAAYPSADASLTQPITNARAVGDELKHDGFDVEVRENLSKEAMQRAFVRLYEKIKPGSVAFVFFSGFGIQSNRQQSYMIPVDAQIYKEDDVHHDGISVDHVLSDMDKRGAGVILDASRRNRFEANFRAAPLGLALPANPPSGTLVMYSAGSGSVVPPEPAGDRSLFVSELLDEMRAPGVSAEEVFNRTRAGVLQASQSQQNPMYTSSLNGPFSFGQSRPQQQVKKDYPPDDEQHGYKLRPPDGKKKGTEEFLDKHPPDHSGGSTTPDAADIRPPPPKPPVVPPPPRVKDADAIKDLDEYLMKHPDDADSFFRRGHLYAKMGDFPSAIKDFDESLRLRPKNAEALNNLCWSRAMIGDSRTALNDCNEALQIRPDYADALDSRGLVKLKLREPSSAIADYDAALQIKKQASSFYGRGLAKKQTGDSAGGESDIAIAKEIDPSIGAEFERSGLY